MHVGDPDPGPERGADRLFRDHRPGTLDLRERDLACSTCLVNLFLRRGLCFAQALGPCEGRLCQVRLRLLRLELRLLHGDVQRDEHGAGLHDLPGGERHLTHRARELVAQGDRSQRQDRSDRGRRGAILPLPGDRAGYGLHGLGLPAGRGIGAPDGGALPGHQAATGHGKCQQEHSRSGPATIALHERMPHTRDLLLSLHKVKRGCPRY